MKSKQGTRIQTFNYSGGGHFINVCSCGNVISQCRCPDATKRRTVIPFGCEACKAQIASATQEQDENGEADGSW